MIDVIHLLGDELNKIMPWMFWRGEVIIFLIGFFVFLGILGYISRRRPLNSRIGLLKIPLTLGDRVFVSTVLLITTLLIILALGIPWFFTFIIWLVVLIVVAPRL